MGFDFITKMFFTSIALNGRVAPTSERCSKVFERLTPAWPVSISGSLRIARKAYSSELSYSVTSNP